jgi:hypothetical protein
MTLPMLGLMVAATACLVPACGGGSGPLVAMPDEGREDPGSTRDTPPNSGDGRGTCLLCDVTYDCSGPQPQGAVSLSTSKGECVPAAIDLICSGALFGAPACSGGGGGPFTCGQVICTPLQGGLPGGSTNGTGVRSADAG